MVAVCGLGCHECGAFFAIKERDGDLASDLYYWSKIEKGGTFVQNVLDIDKDSRKKSGVGFAIF
jgi:hypothetical protein